MPSEAELKNTIRARVVELASRLGKKAGGISDDAILLETGLLDSASVLELLVWLESQLDIEFDQDELSLDNFGSITKMAEFLTTRRAG
ncbi:MAG: acyl carrier protein [Gemmatimonadetes bacterium]|nr:acyl carrier protein [Gemmatimonadota bacterium]